METNYSGALLCARLYYDANRQNLKFDKPEAVTKLAAFGVFTSKEIAEIIGMSVGYVRKHMEVYESGSDPRRVWYPHCLDALYVVAYNYETGGYYEGLVYALVIQEKNSIRAVSELTGVPMNEIRSIVG